MEIKKAHTVDMPYFQVFDSPNRFAEALRFAACPTFNDEGHALRAAEADARWAEDYREVRRTDDNGRITVVETFYKHVLGG